MSNANNETLMTPVKGVSHYQDSASKCHAGDAVTLVPEPENYFDKNAVRVICRGELIGYIAKDLAPRIQALANEGRVSGVISNVVGRKRTGYNVGFRLRITIRDPEPKSTPSKPPPPPRDPRVGLSDAADPGRSRPNTGCLLAIANIAGIILVASWSFTALLIRAWE